MLDTTPLTQSEASEAKAIFNERMNSDQWWVFFRTLDEQVLALEMLREILSYYRGQADGEIEIVMALPGLFFVFAKKSCISEEQVARIMEQYTLNIREIDPEDLIIRNWFTTEKIPKHTESAF
jgi:hypothetical protein